MRITLVGTIWTIKLLSPKDFLKLHDDCYAVTDTDKNIVYFRTDRIDLNTVAHEIFHCIFDSASIENSELDSNQTEEVAATLMGKYLEIYYNTCRKVYKWLKKQK